MPDPNPRLADLSDDDRQILESWLVEFDQGWDEGLLASRVEQIPPGSSWRLPALAEMVKIDLERQWQRGRQISLESYLAQFPELGSPGDVSADLIRAEYEIRREFGAPAALEDYLRRFPHQAAELARLIDRDDPSTLGDEPRGTSPRLPATFGRYTIIRRLGQGGMGSVYLAEATRLGRRVALKVPDFGPHEAPEARSRFLAEAQAAAKLDHPCLCPVYDAGEIDGRLYLTMAYIPGESLAALVGAEGWPESEAAALVGKLALAMQEAHAQKVIHRDLKPANVMIKSTGQGRVPVIVDFGLAHRDNPEEVRLTRSGQVMGTIGYMAPEQIRGDLKEIGPACDIYALGVILYELLTGRLPYRGSGLAVAGQILTETPLPLSTHRGRLHLALEAICLKAMAKQPGDRYRSMGELAAALTESVLSAQGSPAPTPTPTPTTTAFPPAPVASQPPPPAARDSLIDRSLDSLPGDPPSAASRVNPATVTRPWPFFQRLPPPRPLAVAALGLGVLVLGVIAFAIADKGRNKLVENQPKAAVKTAGAPARIRGATEHPRQPAEAAPKPEIKTDSAPPPKEVTNSIGMKLVLIAAGEFVMGSPASDRDAYNDQKPQHPVRITGPFYLGVHEVTQSQYRTVTGAAPNAFKGSDSLPVESVNWFDAIAFCNGLSRRDGLTPFYLIDDQQVDVPDWDGTGYRLPTEAEWEYACRAGSTTRFSFGDDAADLDDYAWHVGNSGKHAHPVGQKRPNAWGLYDMHGNVVEWCWDGYDAHSYQKSPGALPLDPAQAADRLVRGGDWGHDRRCCRSAYRGPAAPVLRTLGGGFRVARLPSVPSGETSKPESIKDDSGPPKTMTSSIGMKLTLIPAGEFVMGSSDSDSRAQADEKPRHPVRITRPFYLGATEVTAGQFRRVVDANGFRPERGRSENQNWGWNEAKQAFEQDPRRNWRNPGFAQTDEHPVVNVSWFDAIAFCNGLSAIEGLKPYYDSGKPAQSSGEGYRLPTEAEWEYACRAGSTTRYGFGEDASSLAEFAWYRDNSDQKTHPVGQKRPNAWGLFDMHGNVWEWCGDWYDAGYYETSPAADPPGPSGYPNIRERVSRGGCWAYDPQCDRSACRDKNTPRYAPSNQGLRVARNPPGR